MFKYLWMVIQDLFITVTYAALMHTMLSRAAGQKGRTIHGIALGAGVLASVALAAVKVAGRCAIEKVAETVPVQRFVPTSTAVAVSVPAATLSE